VRSTQRKPRVTWLGRFVRGRRPDRNPLRRASDLIETAMLAVLVVVFAAAAPFAAHESGAWMHARAHRVQLAQEASWHQVTALLLKSAPESQIGGEVAAPDPQALARWTAPDGRAVTGEVPVPPGTAAGTTVRVWVARDGQLTDPPLQDSQVASQADLAGTFSVVALATLLAVTGLLGRRALDKRRMAAWDADWRAAGPRWTARA
jgi:hypothetical protein